jgi:4-amino-4-deoxy-L-arabinose transferase-like glycosyltransferase
MNSIEALLQRLGNYIDRRERLLSSILLSFAVLMLLINALRAPYEWAGPDGLEYERLGYQTFIGGHPFDCENFAHNYWSPAWVVTIAAIYRVCGAHHTAIRVFLIATALATALIIRRIADRIAGKRAAVAAPAFFLFSTLVFRFTAYYQYELLLGFTVLACCTILFMRGSGEDAKKSSNALRGPEMLLIGLSGLLFGFALLISSRVLIISLLFVSYVCFHAMRSYVFRALPIFIIGLFLILTPWMIRNYRCYGELIFTTTNGGINLYMGNNAESTGGYSIPPEGRRPDYRFYESGKWYREAARYMYAHPAQTLGRSVVKALMFWNPHYGDQVILLAEDWCE